MMVPLNILAILQEEVLLGHSSGDWRRNDHPMGSSMAKAGFSSQPPKFERVANEDKRSPGSSRGKSGSDKMAALMAYRKAKGLCYKCGAKWGPQHCCPESVPLHVVEELWQLVSEGGRTTQPTVKTAKSDSEEDLMAISVQAVNGTSSGKTIRLACSIDKCRAIVLVDSGSSHNFISEQMAALLPGWKALQKPISVKVADGRVLLCTHEVEDCPWLI